LWKPPQGRFARAHGWRLWLLRRCGKTACHHNNDDELAKKHGICSSFYRLEQARLRDRSVARHNRSTEKKASIPRGLFIFTAL
jgi:hypothetical protein